MRAQTWFPEIEFRVNPGWLCGAGNFADPHRVAPLSTRLGEPAEVKIQRLSIRLLSARV
jgi:hypothetical protein